jgi:hypothetical protein
MPATWQSLLAGYRDDDPRRFALACLQRGGLKSGKCADCRHDVYLDPGGQKTLRERDPVLVCMFCCDHYRYVDRVSPQGMVVQL